MIRKSINIILLSSTFFGACKVSKNIKVNEPVQKVILNELEIRPGAAQMKAPYHETPARTADMIHMNLAVSFNYEKQHVLGKWIGTFTAYAYPINKIKLDAKQFILHRVALINEADTLNLAYNYDNEEISIKLNKYYSKKDTFFIYIVYTARPEEIEAEGSAAIKDAKGLYFINPTGKTPGKPRQIWTQGETQSNSGWFPVIDLPNEKITQEIAVTVDEKDLTISNGELMMSTQPTEGKRTDIWKQTKPHAPYLVALVVGNFAEVKDYWRDSIAVNYYVEPEYARYARMIFGKTPEMMEFFTKRFSFDYPWDKYAQVVVRDFVSGAMENTGAVIHFQGLQHTSREHLDETYESTVSHELAHHWFGDLVTCESWSNISLNESFATYCSYLWDEYKYGRMEADYEFKNNLNAYMRSANKHQTPLIRYQYKNREEVFDVVSYQKGSCILHYLRYQLGDSAFFAGLTNYLRKNAFKTVEVHNLRMALEESSGKDLNPFFNQWFLGSGHPQLEVKYRYSENGKEVDLLVKQKQDSSKFRYFDLPVNIDVYANGKKRRFDFTIAKKEEIYRISSADKIDFVNFDADKVIPGIIREDKQFDEWLKQYYQAPLVMDKLQALNAIDDILSEQTDETRIALLTHALQYEFHGIRHFALGMCDGLNEQSIKTILPIISNICIKDEKSTVRKKAFELIEEIGSKDLLNICVQGLNDSSYLVMSAALGALEAIDSSAAVKAAVNNIQSTNRSLAGTCGRILSEYGHTDDLNLIYRTWINGSNCNDLIISWFVLLTRQSTELKSGELDNIRLLKEESSKRDVQNYFKFAYRNFVSYHKTKLSEWEEQKKGLKKNSMRLSKLNEDISKLQSFISQLEQLP